MEKRVKNTQTHISIMTQKWKCDGNRDRGRLIEKTWLILALPSYVGWPPAPVGHIQEYLPSFILKCFLELNLGSMVGSCDPVTFTQLPPLHTPNHAQSLPCSIVINELLTHVTTPLMRHAPFVELVGNLIPVDQVGTVAYLFFVENQSQYCLNFSLLEIS